MWRSICLLPCFYDLKAAQEKFEQKKRKKYTARHLQPGMTAEKCKEIALNAVALATSRDGSSGGVIRLAVIDKTGTQRMVS